MITVMGATGHTGEAITKRLLAAGESVRALGRSPDRLAALAGMGADARVGDAGDAAFLSEAFRGADAGYTLLPYDPHVAGYAALQRARSEAIAQAVGASGVTHVVTLSSVGAELPEGTGLIAGLHAHEQRLRALPQAHVLVLRAGLFFEGFEQSLAAIEQHGVHADSVSPEVPLPMIATCDIAEVAADALRTRAWSGHVVRELLGPSDLTYADVTRILGARIGRPDLAYVQLSDAEMRGTLVDAGLAGDVATLYVEMTRAFNAGAIRSREARTPANTTPTRFETFAASLAAPQPT
jgi:uncharacterized protein YbjT (DUF2867 family)